MAYPSGWRVSARVGLFRLESGGEPVTQPSRSAQRIVQAIASGFERGDPTVPDETTRKALIDARYGQGRFKRDVLARWDGACAVTGCSVSELLQAAHIKPWKLSSHVERLEPQNGLLLLANIHLLFDNKFVSFDDRGRMLISSGLSKADRRLLGLP